jgi:salicylate hydroxylase
VTAREPILIVGAGIAGLATALALARRSIPCRVVERRAGPSAEGAGLQIGPNGTRVLRDLGLLTALAPFADAPLAIEIRNGETNGILTRLPLGRWIEDRHGSPYWVAHRADLAHVLLEAAQRAGVAVSYGTTAPDDVAPVIGADGLWSTLRARVAGRDDAPTFTGRVALRGLARPADVEASLREVVTVWLLPRAHIVAYPIRRGRDLNVVIIQPGRFTAETWSSPVSRAELATRTTSFTYALRSLLTTMSAWREWPIMVRPPLARYSAGQVALVGDAAHPMVPYLAQGAVMAIEDAAAMACSIAASPSDLERAFAAYDTARRPRAERVVAAAATNGTLYHLSGLPALARDLALLTVPTSRLMARYDWLYGAR